MIPLFAKLGFNKGGGWTTSAAAPHNRNRSCMVQDLLCFERNLCTLSRHRSLSVKYTFVSVSDQKPYLAKVRGSYEAGKLNRKFLPVKKEPLRSHKESGPRVRLRFDLEPAIYEQSANGQRSYFAVTGRRIVPLEQDLVLAFSKHCSRNRYSWDDLINQWITSKNKTADGLNKLITDLKRKEEAERRKHRAERKPLLKELVEEISADAVFDRSDGTLTRMYLARLERLGEEGKIAARLFRVQKSSSSAKVYSPEHRDHAYNRKSEVMDTLTSSLMKYKQFPWGWKRDPNQTYAPWVLYVDLPQGQVSFHSRELGFGPDYSGEWDGEHESESRILQFCDSLLNVELDAAEQQVREKVG